MKKKTKPGPKPGAENAGRPKERQEKATLSAEIKASNRLRLEDFKKKKGFKSLSFALDHVLENFPME